MQLSLRAVQDALSRYAEGTFGPGQISHLGLLQVQGFFMTASLMGLGFQVRAGTITTPLVGKVAIGDTAAEFSVDAASGTTIIPVYSNISIRLGTGTVHEYAIKSVGAASSAGAAFIPLPLKTLTGVGAASAPVAVSTARVAANGGVTVAAELATTTRRHWSYSNPVAVGAGNGDLVPDWVPRMPPILAGVQCLYVQIAAATTGPSYYASLEYIEVPTAMIL